MTTRLRFGCGLGAVALLLFASLATHGEEKGKSLDIYFVDVGASVGNATLLVAPSGESVLLDAGPAPMAGRVQEVMKQAGVKQVDYLVTTHYHADHFGATADLAGRVNIVHF